LLIIVNQLLGSLQPYPFERLAAVKNAVTPAADKTCIDLSIGEPKHPTPRVITATLAEHLQELSRYPTTRGDAMLRNSIAAWLGRRFHLADSLIDPERHVVPVNGTREALFAIAQVVVNANSGNRPIVMLPNPFYQIYEGAALMAGAEPYYVNCSAGNDYAPDFDSVPESIWQRCQLLYLCSPGNPTGVVSTAGEYDKVLELSDRYGFVVAADECYSELYIDENEPPLGLLDHAARSGRDEFRRIVVFHSLSKRSNAPGMRSGFVAGDAEVLKPYLLFRTYHGCTLPPPIQAASAAAWDDERHVVENRQHYRDKFAAVLDILGSTLDVTAPQGGFYLWPKLLVDDVAFARGLIEEQNVIVLPGQFVSRQSAGINPGNRHIRIALVAPLAECIEAAQRIRDHLQTISAEEIS
jgi:N-succinyldiaminopimelate aminotransferase